MPKSDPIFAVIERRRVTQSAHLAALEANADWSASVHRACLADHRAIARLLATPPATVLGVLAVIRHVLECEKHEILGADNSECFGFLRTLATALERIAAS